MRTHCRATDIRNAQNVPTFNLCGGALCNEASWRTNSGLPELMIESSNNHGVTYVDKCLRKDIKVRFFHEKGVKHCTLKGTPCKQEMAVGPLEHPVAARRWANGLSGLSKVLASGEFLLYEEYAMSRQLECIITIHTMALWRSQRSQLGRDSALLGRAYGLHRFPPRQTVGRPISTSITARLEPIPVPRL